MDPRVHVRSTWRDPIGTLLTNRRILERMRQGWYGPQLQEKAKARATLRTAYVFRCACGIAEDVRFLHYSYLPQAGWYCPRCLAKYRKENQQEKELKRRYHEAAKREYE
jgi:hypothetical protein